MNERRGTKGLELWCRKMTEGYPGVKIENMTTSWRDGLAFCAMIHHFRPDLIDFTKLNKDDVYHNNELAFRVAEQYLGIPALLEPEDMVEYAVPDRLSILTYLSQFYQAFAAREGASSARIAPKRPQVSSDHGIVSPASTSPPTKVALTTATKPRRELCAKCGLPVFIAERLSIGKSLFHRTCFRCARCNSQLTPANYYETENSEFCCELCPDEEKVTSKTSAQKAVLQRSMSDEEKTASLKTFTDEPDEFSAVFESALENADVEKIQTLNREFVSARSNFFSSQLKSSDSNDSETDDKEEEPPDLPKSLPPISSKTDSVISAQSDSFSVNTQPNSTNSAQYDSGFPNKNDVNSGLKVTLSSNKESQNVVTKDESSEESLVKTRRRLFENNVTDIKADVNRKTVPLSTFTSIPSSIKNNRDNVSDIIEDTPHSTHTSFEKGSVKRPLSERQSPTKKYLSSMSLEVNEKSNIMENNQQQNMLTQSIDKDTNVSSVADSSLDEGISKKDASIYLIDSSQAESRSADCTSKSIEVVNSDEMLTKETPESPVSSQVISNDIEESMKEINSYIEDMKSLEENSSLNATNESQQASSNSIESKLTTSVESDPKLSATDELNSKIIATVDKSFESDDVGIENTENTSIQITSDDPFVSLQEHNGVTEAVNDDVKEQFEGPKETVETINYNVKEVINDSKYEEKVENLNIESDRKLKGNIVETINYNLNEPVLDIHKSKEIVVETINTNVKDFDNSTATSKRPLLEKMESYPDDLNPFDDVEEKQHNQSLNPFGSEDEEEDVGRISKKPIPSPRLKKKVLDASDLRKVMESPMKDVKMTRISVNPFESDDDEKPVPAVRRKKISVPKISLNPFSSDDDESEEIAHKPVPVPRNQRTSGGVHDVKPRDSGGLLHSNIHFGSNSSISSGSYYGSTRKKRPAPKPPIPGFLNDSNASSLTSTPSQSVQHSPKSTPNHRKTKRAPPPPKFTSTPNATPFKSEIQLQTESSKEAGIHSELENAKIVKDEANRNRQSQNLQNEDIEDPNRLSVPNKSTYGKWKRKKGLAPAKPVPQRRTIKCLPMAEIKKELEFIEVQQQGLEKQGVRLEQIIREKCEGTENNTTTADEDIPIEVEDLILQLFELVNEKNELFRKQTELMYLRRQQRLEEEHADVEYQIRCIMMQPEANKTDSDKAREEELIKRLVEIVERRNEIVECLEMDRVREAEEDDSINNHINLFTLSRESDKSNMEVPKKEKSKDKKKPKKEKKSKHKKDKIDVDKDIDTSEVVSTLEKKKKKKFNLFLK